MSYDPEAPDPEMYVLPDITDLEYWDKHQAAGLHQPVPEPTVNGTGGWAWLNLADPEYAIPPDPPAIAGLLYEGKRHVVSGPQESAKTLIAYSLLLLAVRDNAPVAIIDLEMGPVATRRMLGDLGATDDELTVVVYVEPTRAPSSADVERLVAAGVRYVLIDAAAGAFDISGLDDNSRKDAESWAKQWVQPLFREGIATIVLDHVTKNTETRGKYAIGSERKTGGADVHLGLEALKTLTRGGQGIVKVTAHKDRGAYMQRPTVALIELTSDDQTHAVTVTVKPPETIQTEAGPRHTIYMERVSKTLETHGSPMSQTRIEEDTEGQAKYVRLAIGELQLEGYATISDGPRNAKLVHLIKPFREAEYDPVPTPSPPRPDGVHHHPVSPSHPLKGDGDADGVGVPTPSTPTPSPEIDVYDPTIQHLLDDDIPW